MKTKLIKLIAIFSLVALCFLSVQGLFSCRSQKRNKVRADSTIVRSEQKTENWASETVTEVFVDPEDVADYFEAETDIPFPSIFGLSTPESRRVFSKLGSMKKDSNTAITSTSKHQKKKGKVFIRKTEKASGSKASQQDEKKKVSIAKKTTTKEPSTSGSWWLGIWLTLFAAAIIIIILYRSKRRD